MTRDLRGPFILLTLLLGSVLLLPAAEKNKEKDKKAPQMLAIVDATVISVAGPMLNDATVLVRDGKIEEVGQGVDVPRRAQVVDGTGLFVMPGLVDTHSHIGVYALPEVTSHADGDEWTDPISPHVRVIDAVHGGDPAIARSLTGGVTTVQILPGSANIIGGQSAVIKLRGGTAEDMLFEGAPPGMKLAFGENPKRVYGARQKRRPASRMGNAAVLREALVEARDYRRKWIDYDENSNGEGEKDEGPPQRNLKLEALVDLLDGKFRVHVHVYRADDILTVFRIADEFGIKIASLQHCLEGYRVADEIARRGVGASVFAELWGFKMEAWDATPENAALMSSAGVRVAVQSDHPVVEQRYLIHEAARAVHHGLPEEEAYRAVTLNPAWILGLDDRIGSIEQGKDADLAIFDGPPLSVRSHVVMTVIDGVIVYERQETDL